MTKNPESSPSTELDPSGLSKEVIDLGKKIASEIQVGQHENQLLVKWLANLLAQRIKRAEDETDTDLKGKHESQAVELILQIWGQRYSLPESLQPFNKVKNAIEFLAILHADETNEQLPYTQQKELISENLGMLILSILRFRSMSVPLLALGESLSQRDESPLDWEEKNRKFLDKTELTGLDLINRWLGWLGEDETLEDGDLPSVTDDRLSKLVSILEVQMQQLNDAFAVFKGSLIDDSESDQ